MSRRKKLSDCALPRRHYIGVYIRFTLGLYWGYISHILGLYWGYMGIMEKKMETTISEWRNWKQKRRREPRKGQETLSQ